MKRAAIGLIDFCDLRFWACKSGSVANDERAFSRAASLVSRLRAAISVQTLFSESLGRWLPRCKLQAF